MTGKVMVVCGAQYGSEGKGKVVQDIAERERHIHNRDVIAIRCGGPNSGHTVTREGKPIILKSLPGASAVDGVRMAIPAGGAVNVQQLLGECEAMELADRGLELLVDPRAVIVTPEDSTDEQQLRSSIASTASGNGEALVRRMRRRGGVQLAGDCEELLNHPSIRVTNVSRFAMNAMEDVDATIIIEGNQGYGLSLLHGPHYPYTTSRDVTPAGFLSECGIPPRFLTHVIAVMRTYPIRVGGNSGPLEREVDWQTVANDGGWPIAVQEFTSVSKTLRRVGRIDWGFMEQSFRMLQPTNVAVMGFDRLNQEDEFAASYNDLSDTAIEFINQVRIALNLAGCPDEADVNWFGTGPETMFTNGLDEGC